MKTNTIILIIVVFLVLFVYFNKIEQFMDSVIQIPTDLKITCDSNCNINNDLDCMNCMNCGVCVNENNNTACINGDINGPFDKKHVCKQWFYGMPNFILDTNYLYDAVLNSYNSNNIGNFTHYDNNNYNNIYYKHHINHHDHDDFQPGHINNIHHMHNIHNIHNRR
jgi:hypothetical protein